MAKIFDKNDLPNMGAGIHGFSYGFSIYKGIVIQWDEDKDERVLTFLDELPENIKTQLAIVQEHEGCLGLVWHNNVPASYEIGQEIEVDGDFWVIEISRGL